MLLFFAVSASRHSRRAPPVIAATQGRFEFQRRASTRGSNGAGPRCSAAATVRCSTFASARFRNHCSERCSSRNLPLNDSSAPFCHGLPGSMSAVSICAVVQPAQDRARDELRAVVGAQVARRAVHAHELRQHLDDAAGPNAAGHVDRQAFARALVDHRQALQRAARSRTCRTRSRTPRRDSPAVGGSGPRPAGGHASTRPRRGTCSAAWRQSRCVRSALIAWPCARRGRSGSCRYPYRGYCAGQRPHRRQRPAHPARSAATVAQRRSRHGEQGARAAARQAAPLGVGDLLPAHACAYHFFRVISLRTSISRSRSATIFFSRPFSCSSCRSRFTSAGSSVPKCFRQRVDRLGADAVLLGDLRHRPLVGLPQDRHHLLFGESRLLHGSLVSPRAPFSQASAGPKNARQVRMMLRPALRGVRHP